MSAQDVNNLLADKLFQVIGSTPASVAEALRKMNLRGKRDAGAEFFAIAIFASAVNKPTLETFLADARFSIARPLIHAVLQIQNRTNMTAITLLGHCFLTTEMAKDVIFAKEFRKKMGQEHIWAGDFSSGSLSEKQKAILMEKKRVSDEASAKALGNGFLKWTGIISGSMTAAEAIMFGETAQEVARAISPPSRSVASSSHAPRPRLPSIVEPVALPETFAITNTETVSIPADVLNYRRNIMGQTDEDIRDSIGRRGIEQFITVTRSSMRSDPDGKKMRQASSVMGAT